MSDLQAAYSAWIDTPTGTRLAPIDQLSGLSYARKICYPGRLVISFPRGAVDPALIEADKCIEVWRTVPGLMPKLEMTGLIRIIDYDYSAGSELVTLTCEDGANQLAHRIIAYKTQSTRANKTDYADDMLKEIVRENLGASATNTDRDLTAYGVTVEADTSLAPEVTWSFAWKAVLDVLHEICDLSDDAGTRLYFDMTPHLISTTQLGWEFRTMINQFGADRTYNAGVPTVFGPAWGNVADFHFTRDYSEEFTSVYAAGQGEAADRKVTNQVDSTRVNLSPWARREYFVSGKKEIDEAHLIKKALRTLQMGQPRFYATGTLLDTPQTRYGVDWELGDRVIVNAGDFQAEAVIDAVNVEMAENGEETITAQIEVTV
jgi:hypothetical protein